MAQVSRTAAATSAPGAQSAHRPVSNIRGVANTEGGPVEASNAGTGVANHEGFSLFQDYGEDEPRERGGRQQGTPVHLARVTTTSEAFASAMAEDMGGETGGRTSVRGSRGFAGLLARAIKTYEANAQVIHGEVKTRGEAMSFVL